jgi:hypothetical protein
MKTDRSTWELSCRRALTAVAKFAVIPYYHQKLARFEAMLDRAAAVQQAVLFNKLRRCALTDFGREHGFSQIRTVAEFRRQVPISTYDDLAPYVDAVSHGKTTALLPAGDPPLAFACTTGTTGSPKLNPVTRSWLREYLRAWEIWGIKAIIDHPQMIGTKVLQLTGPGNLGRTPSGLNIGMVSSLSSAFQNRFYRAFYAIPPDIADIKDPVARYYLALRLSLPAEVGFVISITPSNLLRLAEVGQQYHESLIRDLRQGTLSAEFDIPDRFRRRLAGRLRIPYPERARALERIVSETGTFFPKDYWPLSLIACWLGGTVGYQSRNLSYYYGSTPARDLGLVSTEGRHTIPFHDNDPQGVLAIDGSFYEFVPSEQRNPTNADVLEAHELSPDREYRLIMTTSSGLYRYDIGDVVRCRGFVGQAPVLEFLHKAGECADLEGEKITGHQLSRAVDLAAREIGLEMDWFLGVAVRRPGDHPHYAIVVEADPLRTPSQSRRFLQLVDRELIRQNVMYAGKRNDRYVDDPRLMVLSPGTWARYIAEEGCRRGTGDCQYKPPTLVTNTDVLARLLAISADNSERRSELHSGLSLEQERDGDLVKDGVSQGSGASRI